MSPILVAKGVTRSFGGVVAVNRVSFELRQGEIMGLIGPNGAGKTSLLNCISQVHRPSEGSLLLDGVELCGLTPEAVAGLGVARTFQVVKPFGQLTVRENTAIGAMFGRGRRSRKEALERADEVLRFTGLDHRRTAYARELPIADRKRMEVARALCMEPKLLLLDEVMAGLNATSVEVVMRLIEQVRKTGVTILLIEHLMKAIMGVCDRVLVLHNGSRIALGTPGEVTRDPQVIQAYLGSRYTRDQPAGGDDDRPHP